MASLPIVAGTLIDGRYLVEACVGAGGSGAVYRARDRERGRTVAVKVLSAASVFDVARFEREASLLSGFAHASIVAYLAHGTFTRPHGEPRRFLVMEWVDGPTLADHAKQPLDAREVIEIGLALAEALQAAHGAGVVHRDVTPETSSWRRSGRSS